MRQDGSAPPANADDAAGGVSVKVVRPSEDIQSYVTFFYFVTCSGPLTDFLYPEWGNVRFSISGDWIVRMPGYADETPQSGALFGPTDRHGVVETSGGKTIGFGLTPLGWNRLIGGNAGAMANRITPLGKRLGADGQALWRRLTEAADDAACVAMMEDAIRQRLLSRPPVKEAVLAVDHALWTRPADVVEFADRAGVSARTLHRLCLDAFGFPPKRLMRLQRFLDTLGLVRSAVGESVRASIDDSYYDQSHFYRDFRDFMAMTPRQYFGAPRHLMAAAAAAQTAAGVTLSFRLPPAPSGR